MRKHRNNSGNALAEVAILLPLYVLFIVGIMYIADLTGIRILLQPVAQDAANDPKGNMLEIGQRISSAYPEGNLNLEITGEEKYPSLDQLLRYTVTHQWHNAHVHYEWRDGRLVPVLRVGGGERDPLISEDLIPLLLVLNHDRLYLTTAYAEFSYAPKYINPVGVPALEKSFEAEHTAMVRGDAILNVAGDASGHPVDAILHLLPDGTSMLHYPDFLGYDRNLWQPDMGRTRP